MIKEANPKCPYIDFLSPVSTIGAVSESLKWHAQVKFFLGGVNFLFRVIQLHGFVQFS